LFGRWIVTFLYGIRNLVALYHLNGDELEDSANYAMGNKEVEGPYGV
jgi:hypothetical protein